MDLPVEKVAKIIGLLVAHSDVDNVLLEGLPVITILVVDVNDIKVDVASSSEFLHGQQDHGRSWHPHDSEFKPECAPINQLLQEPH